MLARGLHVPERKQALDVSDRVRPRKRSLEDRRVRRDPKIRHHRRSEEIDEVVAAGDPIEKGAGVRLVRAGLVGGVQEDVGVEREAQGASSARRRASSSSRSTRACMGRRVTHSSGRDLDARPSSRNVLARSSETSWPSVLPSHACQDPAGTYQTPRPRAAEPGPSSIRPCRSASLRTWLARTLAVRARRWFCPERPVGLSWQQCVREGLRPILAGSSPVTPHSEAERSRSAGGRFGAESFHGLPSSPASAASDWKVRRMCIRRISSASTAR